MATLLNPTADVSDGLWTTNTGGTSLFSAISEDTPDDATYVRSSNNPVADKFRVALENPPGVVIAPPVISYRIYGVGTIPVNMTVRLWQGATLINEWVHTALSSTPTTFNRTLTAGQFAAITDFNALELEFEADATGVDTYVPALEFNDARNSMYIPLIF